MPSQARNHPQIVPKSRKYKKAISRLSQAIDLASRAGCIELKVESFAVQGLALHCYGRADEAMAPLREALALLEGSVDASSIHYRNAVLLSFQLFLSLLQSGYDVLAISSAFSGHMGVLDPNADLAGVLWAIKASWHAAAGEFKPAEQSFQQALLSQEAYLGPTHPLVDATRRKYAAMLRLIGRNDEADKLETRWV